MIKKLICVLMVALLVLLSCVSCSYGEKIAVNISGAEITTGVYTYFYDYVFGNKDKYAIEGEDEEALIKEKTIGLIKDYITVNSMAEKLGVTLSYTLKAQVAAQTDSRWDIFGDYYTSIDVTKQDINKVLTSEALKSALLEYYYGEDSQVDPTSTKKLKERFVKKYIGVNVIAASLTTTDTLGNTVSFDKDELSGIRNVFSNMKDKLNRGADMDTVYIDYITDLDLVGTQSPETFVITETSVGYDETFFPKISALKYNTADVLEYDDTIYLVYRIDISSDDKGYFVTYKSEVLEDMCLSKLEKKITEQAKEYTLLKERNSVTRKIHEAVRQKHYDMY